MTDTAIEEDEQVVMVDQLGDDAVGPILRNGEIAEAAIDAICEDNPDKKVFILDRGDYVRINTLDECILTLESMERNLGREYSLPRLEIEMPSFAGRISTTDAAVRFYNAS